MAAATEIETRRGRYVEHRLGQQGATPLVQLRGLHHDDAEAYLGDVTRPLKALLPGYRELEERVEAAIAQALDLPPLDSEQGHAVKAADDWALFVEAHILMAARGEGWIDAPAEIDTPPWRLGDTPTFAAHAWLQRHKTLSRAVWA